MRKTKSVNFSLVIPSRSMGRLNLLKNCLLSFFKKADHPEDVEAIVLMDLDDEKYCKRVQEFCNSKGYNVQLIIRKNDLSSFNDYYMNHGARCSSGKYIWALNDECEMTTDGWDSIIKDEADDFIEKNLSTFMYILVSDDTHSRIGGRLEEWGSCFPLLSLTAAETINGIIPEEVSMWGGDVHLYNIFKEYAKDYVLDLSSKVSVLHYSHHNGRRDIDEVSRTGIEMSITSGLLDTEMEKYKRRIESVIESGLHPAQFWTQVPESPKEQSIIQKILSFFRFGVARK